MTRDDTSDGNDAASKDVADVHSRRRFLGVAGALGVAGGLGGIALGQQGATTYEFGGRIEGWEGRAPSAIEGQTNPTLELQAGTEYEVVWENLDGLPHDFVIQDEQGDEIVGTDLVSEAGATVTLTFTATEEMAQYICTVHPTTMVGDVEVGGGNGAATPTTPDQQTQYVPSGPTVGAQLVVDGPLVNPVTLRAVPGRANAQVVVDQLGTVYLLQNDELREEPFLDLTGQVLVLAPTSGNFDRSEGFDERGLLGLDFHPDFAENDQLYVRYSAAEPSAETLVGPGERTLPENWDHVEVLSEFTVTGQCEGGTLRADPDSERILLEVPEPQFNHNAGEVTFGPDGYLYTSLGDGGGADDDYVGHVADWYDANEGGNGQDVTENLLGSILRVDVDAEGDGTPYAVPDDNPLVGTEGYDEHYAWGLRNPWRMSFNDGRLITADVGQSLFEEVDLVEKGGNYGWNVREGFHCFNATDATQVPDQCPTDAPNQAPYDGQPLRSPQLEYPHTYRGEPVGISITGGYVYQSDRVPDLSGQYVFGDWSTSFVEPMGRIFLADVGEATTPTDGGDGTATGTPDTATATETANGTATALPVEEQVDVQLPSEQPWPYTEVRIEGGQNQRLNRFVQAFGRDAKGNVYVLASRTGRLTSAAGEIYRLVPSGEGEDITQPATPTESVTETPTETPTGNGTQTPTDN